MGFSGVFAQEPHQKQPKSIDELMMKNHPNEYEALVNHEPYLVVEKLGSKKLHKYFIGDWFGFRLENGSTFKGVLTDFTDSTLFLDYYDQTEQRSLIREFDFGSIKFMFKRNVKPGIDYTFSPLIFLPLALDWAYFKRPPWQSAGSLVLLGGIEAGRIVLINNKKLFNRRHFAGRWRMRKSQY
ncbi:hypothetical protein LAG90_16680 [Marinilongibacter aquaticus]|uniref:hypothetical protein n=1 Tax=Marinilongibacter aquaticus TaxID=2975157 RepID=UPI0021BD6219|nr:hypothetical protein [Marinilongibacter aquaticus]UBM58440.1 hypothetical protein LAG90_16680 [Marinilongibacter aquaticus]